MPNAREIALEALIRINVEGGYSNIVVNNIFKEYPLDSRDKALASAIIYGVLERKLTLDYIISGCSNTPIKKLSKYMREVLRIGIYQLLYMDKIPESAAINESVKLIKTTKDARYSGFANGVLRTVQRKGKANLDFSSLDEENRLSIEYSSPKWLVKHFIKNYGLETAGKILASAMGSKGIIIRVNTTKITSEYLLSLFSDNNISANVVEFCKDAIEIKNCDGIERLPGFKEGYFHVQDSSSQLCSLALSAKEGESVLDLCAAPGGKSFTIAELMNNKGHVLALDLYDSKIDLINNGALRLGLSIVSTDVNDAENYNEKLGQFDRVLCDVPCSGLGILGNKPEIRYKNVVNLDFLPDMQYRILCNGSKYLKVGGVLVYSTCTLNPEENNNNAARFLADNKNYEPFDVLPQIERSIDEPINMLTLMPYKLNTDGFFISAFKRIK